MRRLKILLTEGSSLSARQTLYALGGRGFVIDICDPNSVFCLSRFSRFVRRCWRCPSFGANPISYVEFLVRRLKTEHYDILFPVHDQVYVLSRFREELEPLVRLPVPDFAALERLQSKAEFSRLMTELGLPQPHTTFVKSRAELERAGNFPCYVKLSYSTAGCGVWLVQNQQELHELAERLQAERLHAAEYQDEMVIQRPAAGVFCVAQSVFQRGQLLAAHTYQARAQGVGGSAYARIGVHHPVVLDHLARLGAHLNWHGALMLEYLFDQNTGQPTYIEANPRIGETVNATLSGVNLCTLLVGVALDKASPCHPVTVSPGHPVTRQPMSMTDKSGVKTHSLVMSLLARALATGSRKAIFRELWEALNGLVMGAGLYAKSQDEVTRPRDDFLSLIPAAFVAVRLLLRPQLARRLIHGAVDSYFLSEKTLRVIRKLPQRLF